MDKREKYIQALTNDKISQKSKYFEPLIDLVEFIDNAIQNNTMERFESAYDMLFDKYSHMFKKKNYVSVKLRQTLSSSYLITRKIGSQSPIKYCMYVAMNIT